MNHVKSIDLREENILLLADELLSSSVELDEATIDCQFLFRFEPVWDSRVKQIRQQIWGLLGETSELPLSMNNQEHLRLMLHLRSNIGVSVGVNIGTGATGLFIENDGRGYRPFNIQLRELNDNSLETLSRDRKEFEQVWTEIWKEANQVSKIHSEIRRLGLVYGLIPPEHEFDNYSPKELMALYEKVFSWIMWGRAVPSFRWSMTHLIENKLKDRRNRIIHPHEWPKGHWQEKDDGGSVWVPHKLGNTKRMTVPVRIRTWAIYFLTKRGGGNRTEDASVNLWNQQFPEHSTNPKSFRNERSRLFNRGTKKSAQDINLYPGLSS